MLYKKKPVVIEAIQWNGSNIDEIKTFCPDAFLFNPIYPPDVKDVPDAPHLNIPTLEGIMMASVGDYIICGVNGEFYPCKPDIFEKTYEAIER